LYWLNHGSENRDILDRKRLFSANRGAFETVLLEHKQTIINELVASL
jgi:hypothetical protein